MYKFVINWSKDTPAITDMPVTNKHFFIVNFIPIII